MFRPGAALTLCPFSTCTRTLVSHGGKKKKQSGKRMHTPQTILTYLLTHRKICSSGTRSDVARGNFSAIHTRPRIFLVHDLTLLLPRRSSWTWMALCSSSMACNAFRGGQQARLSFHPSSPSVSFFFPRFFF